MALRRETFFVECRAQNSTDTTIDSLSICTTTLTACGDGVVIEQPRCSGRDARCCEKCEFAPVSVRDLIQFSLGCHDRPCHNQYHAGALPWPV